MQNHLIIFIKTAKLILSFFLIHLRPNDDSPASFVRLWNHAERTNGLYPILKTGRLHAFGDRDVMENGASVFQTCTAYLLDPYYLKKTYFNRCSIPAIDISHTVPHKNSRLGEMYEVPTKMRCRTMDSFGLPKGASWHESINSVLLRLQQTGHDQKFYYRC